MKLNRFILAYACLLLLGLMIACGIGPEAPEPPTQSVQGLVEELTLNELAVRANSILVGEVTDITVYKEGEGNIYTLVTLSVEQAIKGEPQEEGVIKIPGGEVNGQALWVEDVPEFQLGERAVVFLDKRGDVFSVVGWFQGKFSIDKNDMVSGNIPLSEFVEQLGDILAKQ